MQLNRILNGNFLNANTNKMYLVPRDDEMSKAGKLVVFLCYCQNAKQMLLLWSDAAQFKGTTRIVVMPHIQEIYRLQSK